MYTGCRDNFVSRNTHQLLVPMRKCKQEVRLSCQSSWISVILSCRVKHTPTKIRSKSKCSGRKQRAIIKCCSDRKENNSLRIIQPLGVTCEMTAFSSPLFCHPSFTSVTKHCVCLNEVSVNLLNLHVLFIYLFIKKAFVFRGRLYTQELLHFSLPSAQLHQGSFILF